MQVPSSNFTPLLLHVVQELTKKKTELQLRLRHMPTDSLGAKILKDVAVEGTLAHNSNREPGCRELLYR